MLFRSVRDDARLAGPRPCEDEHGAGLVKDGGSLFGVQARDEIHRPLFYRDALGEIARLIDVASATHGDVVRQELQRDGHHDRREEPRRARH